MQQRPTRDSHNRVTVAAETKSSTPTSCHKMWAGEERSGERHWNWTSRRHKPGKQGNIKEGSRQPRGETTEQPILGNPLKRPPFPYLFLFMHIPLTLFYLPLHCPHDITDKVIWLQLGKEPCTQVSTGEAPLRGPGRGAIWYAIKKSPKPWPGMYWAPELLKTPSMQWKEFMGFNWFHHGLWKRRCVFTIPE